MNYDFGKAKLRLMQLGKTDRPVYFVPGNMDNPQLGEWGGQGNVRALHGRHETFQDLLLMGLGGSPHGPFITPFEYDEDTAARLLHNLSHASTQLKIVLVSHCPPKYTKLDLVSSGEHAGSSAVRGFVEHRQPFLVVSGHIHEAQGKDVIERTTLVNTGPAQRGNYAKIDLSNTVDAVFQKLF